MTDIQTIFSPPMVQALVREAEHPGTGKTMTRRMAWTEVKPTRPHDWMDRDGRCWIRSPWQKVKPGDRLWVKETHWRYGEWRRVNGTRKFFQSPIAGSAGIILHTPRESLQAAGESDRGWHKWPSILLPRALSRLTLVVTAPTKRESLQAISEADAKAEGVGKAPVPAFPDSTYQLGFKNLWVTLHGRDGWDANPEVVAISFDVHRRNVDDPLLPAVTDFRQRTLVVLAP